MKRIISLIPLALIGCSGNDTELGTSIRRTQREFFYMGVQCAINAELTHDQQELEAGRMPFPLPVMEWEGRAVAVATNQAPGLYEVLQK